MDMRCPAPVIATQATAPTQPPARVLRVLHNRRGHLVVSGRMADVCAEIQRMARREQALLRC